MSLEPRTLLGSFSPGFVLAALGSPDQTERPRSGPLGLMRGLLYAAAAILATLVLAALLLWWWLNRRPSHEDAYRADMPTSLTGMRLPTQVRSEKPEPPRTLSPRVEAPASEPPPSDELQRIRGIGPKIAALLQSAGIRTYAQLAATDVSHLHDILAEQGWVRLANPASWSEQARLAAAGEWEAFKALQEELKGRR